MDHSTETPQWGSFALVSYIPDPLGSFLYGLRQTLSGEDNPQPHITLLPPRPLMLPVDAASQMAKKILLDFPAFEVELSEVRCFPDTSVLYLDVGKGSGLIRNLHSALNQAELKYPEEFLFRPHLTLGGPVTSANLDGIRAEADSGWQAARCPRKFLLDEIVFLWLKPDNPQREWLRLWSYRLSASGNSRVRAATAAVTTQTY